MVFFLPGGTNTSFSRWEKYRNRHVYREWETLEPSVLNGNSSSNFSFQSSGNLTEREVERLKEPKKKQDTKETNHSRCNGIDAHMKLQRSWYHSQGLPRPKSDGVPGLRDEVDTACIPSPDTISDPQKFAKGNLFFYNGVSLGIHITF